MSQQKCNMYDIYFIFSNFFARLIFSRHFKQDNWWSKFETCWVGFCLKMSNFPMKKTDFSCQHLKYARPESYVAIVVPYHFVLGKCWKSLLYLEKLYNSYASYILIAAVAVAFSAFFEEHMPTWGMLSDTLQILHNVHAKPTNECEDIVIIIDNSICQCFFFWKLWILT